MRRSHSGCSFRAQHEKNVFELLGSSSQREDAQSITFLRTREQLLNIDYLIAESGRANTGPAEPVPPPYLSHI